tara:strand:+ start:52 stop:441 length:390 start_codon:yes stop_codon:yes gene_type:complete
MNSIQQVRENQPLMRYIMSFQDSRRVRITQEVFDETNESGELYGNAWDYYTSVGDRATDKGIVLSEDQDFIGEFDNHQWRMNGKMDNSQDDEDDWMNSISYEVGQFWEYYKPFKTGNEASDRLKKLGKW